MRNMRTLRASCSVPLGQVAKFANIYLSLSLSIYYIYMQCVQTKCALVVSPPRLLKRAERDFGFSVRILDLENRHTHRNGMHLKCSIAI